MSTSSDYSLVNKIAIVTGGSGFLGQQHCLALLEKGCIVYNFDLSPLDLTSLPEFANYKERFVNIICDVRSEKSVEVSFDVVIESHGKIDVLVNNACIDHKVPSNLSKNQYDFRFENFDFSSWQNEFEVGLNGAIFCSKYAAKTMIKNNSGVIINISSDLGSIAPDQRIYEKDLLASTEIRYFKPFSYSVIKHGLIGLTKYLATYLAEYDIRVNALSPGSILNFQDSEFIDRLENIIPLGRLAKVHEYRGAIQFLASDASSYMTGQNLVIDGGRSTW